ncbi:MAG: glycerophosphodiester phosphodiesterase [Acidimicrobiia bacterium]|nr:glycerophosphodiester phosphodiesterase [Acidimicrobiia bacterium]
MVDRLSRRRTSVDPVVDPAVVISSFNVPTLERVREIDRSVDTAWLTLPDLEPLAAVRAAAHRDLQGVHVAHRALSRADVPGVVGRAHDLGVALRPWTVNDAGEIRRFVAAGVDAVITDRPSAAVALRDAVAADASSGA